MEPEYSWQAVRSSGSGYYRDPVSRNYRWWVMLALVMAALFHLALFAAFEKIEIKHLGLAAYDQVFQLSKDRERITIDKLTEKRLADEDLLQPKPEVKEIPRPEVLPPMEDLPLEMPQITETIRFTPEVSEPQNLFTTAPGPDFSKVGNVGTVEDKMSFDLKELAAGEAVKNDLLKASQKVSPQQPKIQIKSSDLQVGLESDDLVERMTNTLGGADGAKIQKRFDSLDELLGSGKAMPSKAEILMPTDLLFEFGSAEVKEEAKLSLMKLGMLIMANPKSTFLFKGYTDSIPFRFGGDRLGPKDNLQLSTARAEAVRNWLATSLDLQGFDLRVQGFGDSNPLVQSSPLENIETRKIKEALNRRVEVEILSKR